ncbi:hypothetical protein OY671_010081, partial [Metschnikowia pulcherrima]
MSIEQAKDQISRYLPTAHTVASRQHEQLNRIAATSLPFSAIPQGRCTTFSVRASLAAAQQGWPSAKMDIATQRDSSDIFVKSAREFLDGWYEDDHVKSAFAFDAVVGNYAGVSTPGSAYVSLHHVFGEVNGKFGAWGHSVGGMGSITQAMARACEDAGV